MTNTKRLFGLSSANSTTSVSSKDKEVSLVGFDDSKSPEDMIRWLSIQLNRPPDPVDLYACGKETYNAGMYRASSIFLERYVQTPNALLPGHHLLGYAFAAINHNEEAIRHLVLCANSGFDADWQVIVELLLESLEDSQQPEQLQAQLT